MTFEQYLKKNTAAGVIDFALRVDSTINGHPKFYIHPAYQEGLTIDFFVEENDLHLVNFPILGEERKQ